MRGGPEPVFSMSIDPNPFLRLRDCLLGGASLGRSIDLTAEGDRVSIKLTAANGSMLPMGRYLLTVTILPGKERCGARFEIGLNVAKRVLPFTLELGGRRACLPVVLMQDLPDIRVFAETDIEVLSGARWQLRPMAYLPFYAILSVRAGWRLLSGEEDRRRFLDAISRNGLNGFGDAVRGDWEAALRMSHSGFTRRMLHYPDGTSLPKRPAILTPGVAVVGDFSADADMPHLDENLLKRASLAGLTAFCLPCKREGDEFRFPSPVRRFLDTADLHFPFFFCCADVQMERVDRYGEYAFAEAISPWFDDPRHLRVDGRPVVAVRSQGGSANIPGLVNVWRAAWSDTGNDALVVATIPPNGLPSRLSGRDSIGILVSDDGQYGEAKRGARSLGAGIPDTPPARFGRLVHAAINTVSAAVSGPSFVFVGLGISDGVRPRLTEDERYGYAWIESLRVAQARCSALIDRPRPELRTAVAIHAFYPELLGEMLEMLHLKPAHKLFVTTVDEHKEEVEGMLRVSGADYALRVFENRGRDVLPFMKIYEEIVAEGFDIVAKIHTKKSGHRRDGDVWRRSLIDPILDGVRFARILEAFERDESLGMTGPRMHLTSLKNNIVENEARVFGLARRLGLMNKDVRKGKFFAGSMFVARVSALAPLMSLAIDDENFEPEAGQLDGTMAHAVERGFALSVISCGMRLAALEEVTRKRRAFWWTPAQ